MIDDVLLTHDANRCLYSNETPVGTASALANRESPNLVSPSQQSKLSVVGLFAGIGGIEEGFRQAGHESIMLCEADSSAREVLKRRFHTAEVTPDVKELTALPNCDVVTAGFPCQDLSQVGQRKGIAGPNSGLVDFVFRLLERQKRAPQWLILENVPFMLSLHGGRAIRNITGILETLGYAWAYRTIDTRAFGLPQRRRRVILLASKDHDPRPVLFGMNVSAPAAKRRGCHACGFYWTEGNTGLGWAVDAVPPLKGGSGLNIPSAPAIWFPRRRLIAVPAIEDAERLQGFLPGWTDISGGDPQELRKRWRMIGNAVSVPVAKWLAERLTADPNELKVENVEEAELPSTGSWPTAAWSYRGKHRRSVASEWPREAPNVHLATFLKYDVSPLSKKATSGFLSRLISSNLRYENAFCADLAHHAKNFD